MEWNGTRREMLTGATLLSLTGALALLEGCSKGGGTVNLVPTQPTTLRSILRGAQENPAVVTNGTGLASFVINANNTSLDVSLQTTGLVNVVKAHIHVGKAGTNGPIIFTLYDGAPQTLTTLNLTLTAANLTAQPAANVTNFEEALQAIVNGLAYVNVHTAANPTGEIRGQIGTAGAFCSLSGASVVPPVVATANASALIRLSKDQDFISVSLGVFGLTNITSAHIRVGAPNANGPAIFTLSDVAFTNSLIRNLFSTDFSPQPGAGVTTFNDAISAILSGNAYIEIRTQANPNGAVRGTIQPQGFNANMTGANEVPALTTVTATGTLFMTLSKDGSTLNLNVQTQGLTNVTKAHLHIGAAGVIGPVVFELFESTTDGAFTGSITKQLTAANLTPQAGAATFAEFLTALANVNIYCNIHTQARPTGEIRGQVISLQ